MQHCMSQKCCANMASTRQRLLDVLDYLADQLDARDFLNLRACCKQYHKCLTGAMPPLLFWSLTAESPCKKVRLASRRCSVEGAWLGTGLAVYDVYPAALGGAAGSRGWT